MDCAFRVVEGSVETFEEDAGEDRQRHQNKMSSRSQSELEMYKARREEITYR